MLNAAPVEELQNLFNEREEVVKKIVGVEAALTHIKKSVSASLASKFMEPGEGRVEFKEDLMKEEQTYERLLQALRDMQAEIEQRVRPVAEQVIQAEIDRLRTLSERRRNALADCITMIDQSLLSCRVKMTEYHHTKADLQTLNERLAKLGADPIPIPEFLPTENLGDLIMARIENLRAEGKI